MESSISSFGVSSDYFSINGRLVFNSTSTNKNACLPITDYNFNVNEIMLGHFPIYLVETGGCSYVTKARNVQNALGFAVVIINDNDNVENTIIPDDGTSSDIYIPAILISKKNGNIIKQYFEDFKNDPDKLKEISVSIEHSFKLSNNVKIDMFFSSDDKTMYTFLKNLLPSIEDLSEQMEVIPTFITYEKSGNEFVDQKNCIGNLRYCYPTVASTYSGKEVLIEDLYQSCIFMLYGTKNSPIYELKKVTSYIEEFSNMCVNPVEFKDDILKSECRKKAADEAGIDLSLVEKCIAESYEERTFHNGLFEQEVNSILDNNIKNIQKYSIRHHPTLYLNNELFNEAFAPDKLLYRACMMLDKKPDMCEIILNMQKEENIGNPHKKGKKFIIIIITLIVVFNIILFFLCRKYLANKISERIESSTIDIDGRINSTVGKYFQLDGK